MLHRAITRSDVDMTFYIRMPISISTDFPRISMDIPTSMDSSSVYMYARDISKAQMVFISTRYRNIDVDTIFGN